MAFEGIERHRKTEAEEGPELTTIRNGFSSPFSVGISKESESDRSGGRRQCLATTPFLESVERQLAAVVRGGLGSADMVTLLL